jgi:hypothetical protein
MCGLLLGLALLQLWADATETGQPLRFEYAVIDANGPLDIWLKSVGDLNGDGRPDLIAGGHESGGLVWYENPTWEKHVIAEGSFSTTEKPWMWTAMATRMWWR